MTFDDMICEVNAAAESFLEGKKEVRAEELGLDPRAFWGEAYVTEDCIAVLASQDRTLQYYGGFEYVEKSCRICIGGWVFYMAEDDRVRRHLAEVFEDLREEYDEEENLEIDLDGGLSAINE